MQIWMLFLNGACYKTATMQNPRKLLTFKYYRRISIVGVGVRSYFVFKVVFAQISGLSGSSITMCQCPLMRTTKPWTLLADILYTARACVLIRPREYGTTVVRDYQTLQALGHNGSKASLSRQLWDQEDVLRSCYLVRTMSAACWSSTQKPFI